MKLQLTLAAAVLVLGSQAPALAYSISYGDAADLTGSSLGLSPALGVSTFDGTEANSVVRAPYDTTLSTPFTDGPGYFTDKGIVVNNGASRSGGVYATPFGDTSNYLAVVPNPAGSPAQVDYTSTYTFLGLYWGSIDTYNSITFYLDNVATGRWCWARI